MENENNSYKATGQDKVHQCKKCPSRFETVTRLQSHDKQVHCGRRFACEKCQKMFKTRGHVKEHMLSHSTNKPLKCDQCEYRCHRNVDLREHKRLHLGLKPFKCTECPAAYTSRHMLNYHLRTHTGRKVVELSFGRAIQWIFSWLDKSIYFHIWLSLVSSELTTIALHFYIREKELLCGYYPHQFPYRDLSRFLCWKASAVAKRQKGIFLLRNIICHEFGITYNINNSKWLISFYCKNS